MTTTNHGACGRTWTQRGNRTSHCDGCHATFATLDLFDRHRTGPWEARRCLDPATENLGTMKRPVAVAQDDEGVWSTPEGLANREAVGIRLGQYRARPNAVDGYTETPEREMGA